MRKFRVIAACGLALSMPLFQAGCDDDDDNDNGTRPDAGGGMPDAGGPEDAGPGDAGTGGNFELTGDAGPVEGTATAAQCTSTTDNRDEGMCYGFFCGTNSNSIAAALTEDSPCATNAEVFLICDGEGVREASRCARVHALDSDPREGTRTCMRENPALDPFSDACLDCFLDSADCAREFCVSECLAGDSPGCDACREENGCTPDYYTCSGLPNPQ
jgi:hypothetical protein